MNLTLAEKLKQLEERMDAIEQRRDVPVVNIPDLNIPPVLENLDPDIFSISKTRATHDEVQDILTGITEETMFANSYTIPANYMQVGMTFMCEFGGYYSTPLTPATTIARMYANDTVIADSGTLTSETNANENSFHIFARFTVKEVGVNGKIETVASMHLNPARLNRAFTDIYTYLGLVHSFLVVLHTSVVAIITAINTLPGINVPMPSDPPPEPEEVDIPPRIAVTIQDIAISTPITIDTTIDQTIQVGVVPDNADTEYRIGEFIVSEAISQTN